jgi:uncharacterized phage-associated protein
VAFDLPPTTVSAHDVARELRRRLPSAGVLKVQKLLYYCQGWSLAWHGAPLFGERIEAWDQGPVVATVWHDEHDGREAPPEQPLTIDAIEVVDYVVTRYGDLSGEELRDLTHAEAPWSDLADEAGDLRSRNARITDEALRAWFTQDEAYVRFQAEAARLRARRDVYGFEGDPIPPALLEATERVLSEHAAGRAP